VTSLTRTCPTLALILALPLALTLSLTPPLAAAQAPAPAPAPAQQTAPFPAIPVSDVWTVLRAASQELDAADDPMQPLPVRLERVAAFRYSPDTAARLARIFGSERPYTVERLPGAKGGTAWRAGLPPLRHTDAKGLLTEWDALRIDARVDKSGRGLETRATWPSIASGNDELRFRARGLAYDNKVRFGFGGLWFGKVGIRADSLEAASEQHGFALRAEDVRVDAQVIEKPKAIDQVVSLDIKTIRFGGQPVTDFRLAMRFLNFDKQASADMVRESRKVKALAEDTPPEQRLEALKPSLRALGKSMLAKGAVAQIDELGLSYGGHRATLKGRMQFVNATLADLDDLKLLLTKKLVARFDIRIPVALVREIAGAFAARQVAAQAAQTGGSADPQAIAQLRQSMTDVVVGKLLGGGFARIENDVLVSHLEWRNGTLSANGKPVALPTPQAQPQPQPQTSGDAATPPSAALPMALEPGPDNFLQARLVEGSCTLPAFPEDVIRADQALRQRIDYVIGLDGHVKDARLSQPSGSPDYDRAMLAAIQECTYVPALRAGRPIELRTSRETVRAAGAGHP